MLFLNFNILFVFNLQRLIIKKAYADVGLSRPTRLRHFDRQGEEPITVAAANLDGVEALMELEHNLERLNLDILETRVDDIPV